MGYKPSIEAKLYKLNTTKLDTLKDLNEAQLSGILKEWARLGNMRATRVKKIDPLFSALHEYKKGGRYGKKEKYRDKDTMLNELRRIKVETLRMNKKEVVKEEQEIKRILDGAKASPKFDIETSTFDEIKFRQGFAMYRDNFTSVDPAMYEKVRDIVKKASERDLYDVYYLIIRAVDEMKIKEAQQKQKKYNKPNEDTDDLPY